MANAAILHFSVVAEMRGSDYCKVPPAPGHPILGLHGINTSYAVQPNERPIGRSRVVSVLARVSLEWIIGMPLTGSS